MAKPEVPSGPIKLTGNPGPMSVKTLAENIAALASTDLEKLQGLIDQGKWEQVVNRLNALSMQARRVQNSATRLGSRAAKQHWSPLLEGQADG